MFTDLFALYSIDDWVHHGGNKDIEVGQQDMDMLGDILAKALSSDSENPWEVEHEDDTNVGTAGAESFHPSIMGWQPEDGLENEPIRDDYCNHI